MAARSRQIELLRTWGGRRVGAGRKPSARRRMTPHRRRAPHDPHCPVHVTLRSRDGLPSLRGNAVFSAVRGALARASCNRFRLLHFSVQSDHLHLLVEADEPTRLARGVQGLAIRVARAINRALRRRGRVWDGRYHARALRTPREVRNALIYILQNFKKHVRGATGLDSRSSAAWLVGWRTLAAKPQATAPVVAARTWLARIGWKRGGLLSLFEAPRPYRRRAPVTANIRGQ